MKIPVLDWCGQASPGLSNLSKIAEVVLGLFASCWVWIRSKLHEKHQGLSDKFSGIKIFMEW